MDLDLQRCRFRGRIVRCHLQSQYHQLLALGRSPCAIVGRNAGRLNYAIDGKKQNPADVARTAKR
jgi:hypothetical protein